MRSEYTNAKTQAQNSANYAANLQNQTTQLQQNNHTLYNQVTQANSANIALQQNITNLIQQDINTIQQMTNFRSQVNHFHLNRELTNLTNTEYSLNEDISGSLKVQEHLSNELNNSFELLAELTYLLNSYTHVEGVRLNHSTLQAKLLPQELLEQSSLVQESISTQSVQKFDSIISRVNNVNFTDQEGKTPLMISLENTFFYGVEKLLDMNADVDIVDSKGKNALIYSSFLADLKYTDIIIQKTKDANFKYNVGGATVMHILLDMTVIPLETSLKEIKENYSLHSTLEFSEFDIDRNLSYTCHCSTCAEHSGGEGSRYTTRFSNVSISG